MKWIQRLEDITSGAQQSNGKGHDAVEGQQKMLDLCGGTFARKVHNGWIYDSFYLNFNSFLCLF